MQLWTVQHPSAHERLEREGVLRADGRRVKRSRRAPYRWLMGQMARRLPSYSGRYPLWAWRSPKPDVNWFGYFGRPGEKAVRIEFVLGPEEATSRVLLSDLDAWGWHVLNGWYLYLSDEEYLRWHRTAADLLYGELPPLQQEVVRLSWERIFDLGLIEEARRKEPVPHGSQRVQAVLEEIRLEEVVRVEEFTVR